MHKKQRKAVLDRAKQQPNESEAEYEKRIDKITVRGYQLYTRKIKPTFEEWAKKLRTEFGSEAGDDYLQDLWTEITEKRKQKIEDVFRRLAKSRGQEYKPAVPYQSEVPAAPATPVAAPSTAAPRATTAPTSTPTRGPWVRGPIPPWAKRWSPEAGKPSSAVPSGEGQMAARVIFALARLITAAMLLWALARHPIGYYTVLRLVTAGVCLYAAYLAVQEKQTGWVFIFGGMVLLFQPLIPLRMTRQTWNNIDVIAALFLIASIGLFKRPSSSEPANRTGKEDEKIADEFINELAALEEAQEITEAYGGFLSKGAPIIADAKLLPYPKPVIKQALLKYEQHLCDIANEYVASGQSEKLQELDKLLNAVGACSMSLNSYTNIEAQDREHVSYFNSYDTINDVPEEEQPQCLKLMVKYMSKGMEEEIPGWTERADSASEKD